MFQRFLAFILLFIATEKTFAQQSTASEQVSTFTIEAPQLHTTKKIWIYLPKNYGASQKKYPVIYMHDGQNLFDAKTSSAGEWNVDEKLDSLHAQVIVVGIENENEKQIEELTPYKNAKYGGGNADNYLDFIVKTLKPAIDTKYRTKTNARNTGIFGSSLGGLVSYYAVLKYPEIFGKAGIFSPTFSFNRKEIIEFSNTIPKLNTKIYLLCGDNEADADIVSDLNKIDKLISEKRCECVQLTKKKIVKRAQNNEKLWRDGFAKAFVWLF